MKIYAVINNNVVINVIVATDTFVPPNSTYVLTDTIVSVGDRYENGAFIDNTPTITPTPTLTLEEIDAILAAIENENNS